MHRTALVILLLLTPGLAQVKDAKPPKPSIWVQDYELARSQARARSCDLLIAIVGPLDEGDNKLLEGEVLAKPEFGTEAGKLFVLMRCDCPKDESTVPELQRVQYSKLRRKYPAQHLPMVWLTDGMGNPYAKTGYQPGGAKSFLAMLDGKRQANQKARELLQKAATLRGMERANALAEAFRHLDDDIVASEHFREMLEIITTDADGKAGLKDEFDAIARDNAARPFFWRMQDEVEPLVKEKNWTELDAKIEAGWKKHGEERWARQYLMYLQGIRKLEGDGDAGAAVDLFTNALALAERSALAPAIARRQPEAAAAFEKQQKEAAEKAKAEAAKAKKKK